MVKMKVFCLFLLDSLLLNLKKFTSHVFKLLEPAHKRLKTEDMRLLGSELIVYDKYNRCLLTGGEYDLVLRDVSPTVPIIRSPHKALTAHWETISDVNDFSVLFSYILYRNSIF